MVTDSQKNLLDRIEHLTNDLDNIDLTGGVSVAKARLIKSEIRKTTRLDIDIRSAASSLDESSGA